MRALELFPKLCNVVVLFQRHNTFVYVPRLRKLELFDAHLFEVTPTEFLVSCHWNQPSDNFQLLYILYIVNLKIVFHSEDQPEWVIPRKQGHFEFLELCGFFLFHVQILRVSSESG